MSVKKTLEEFGRYVVQQSKSNLTRKGKKDRGELYDSLGYSLKVSPNSFQLDIVMEDYGKFVDKGVKGVSSSQKAPRSPYKFGTGTGRKGGLTQGIKAWVRRKGFQFRDEGGRFTSFDSTAFVIIRSIWQTGLETTNFITTPFERAFQRLPDDIVEAYGLEVESFLESSLV